MFFVFRLVPAAIMATQQPGCHVCVCWIIWQLHHRLQGVDMQTYMSQGHKTSTWRNFTSLINKQPRNHFYRVDCIRLACVCNSAFALSRTRSSVCWPGRRQIPVCCIPMWLLTQVWQTQGTSILSLMWRSRMQFWFDKTKRQRDMGQYEAMKYFDKDVTIKKLTWSVIFDHVKTGGGRSATAWQWCAIVMPWFDMNCILNWGVLLRILLVSN